MESQYAVEVGGERFAVPRQVEAEGGAAIQTYLEGQPGYLEAVARDRAEYEARLAAARESAPAAESPMQTAASRKGGR